MGKILWLNISKHTYQNMDKILFYQTDASCYRGAHGCLLMRNPDMNREFQTQFCVPLYWHSTIYLFFLEKTLVISKIGLVLLMFTELLSEFCCQCWLIAFCSFSSFPLHNFYWSSSRTKTSKGSITLSSSEAPITQRQKEKTQ